MAEFRRELFYADNIKRSSKQLEEELCHPNNTAAKSYMMYC